ncbi:hypothetical protein G4B88_026792 [Cannabis sativa]|uniref:Uncharacterized protein n=1 Tax=Cannabis sativa TaxID=3483 RepID=A0A7J6F9J1_CANSA|nr:hypothetical protein G4B88_026792 [Cannabis sativa]
MMSFFGDPFLSCSSPLLLGIQEGLKQEIRERPESEVIDEIVKEIFTLLNSSSLSSCVSDGS